MIHYYICILFYSPNFFTSVIQSENYWSILIFLFVYLFACFKLCNFSVHISIFHHFFCSSGLQIDTFNFSTFFPFLSSFFFFLFSFFFFLLLLFSDSSKWEWKKDFMKIIHNLAGLKKLQAKRPSTAVIGEFIFIFFPTSFYLNLSYFILFCVILWLLFMVSKLESLS